jgi:hypothetical protein
MASMPTRTATPTHTIVPRPIRGLDGVDFEEIEHIVSEDDPDTALCGVDQTDVQWNQGLPVCRACAAVAEGRIS